MSGNTTNLGKIAQTGQLIAQDVQAQTVRASASITATQSISSSGSITGTQFFTSPAIGSITAWGFNYPSAYKLTQGTYTVPVATTSALTFGVLTRKYISYYDITATSGTVWNFAINLLTGISPAFLQNNIFSISQVWYNQYLDPSSIITHLHLDNVSNTLNLLVDSSTAVTYTGPLTLKVVITTIPD